MGKSPNLLVKLTSKLVCQPHEYYPRCWCWNIYLQNRVIFGVNVGNYSSTIEHLGIVISCYIYHEP